MDKDIVLGDIEELPLNRLFKLEDRHFTPWLQKNIEVLGNIIGIDIIDAETEVPIGNYRLDILAYESGTERKIAIENQYGTTNHTHLGQLITYMAGINAEVVVWIAEDFNTEHITAINHLNQISNEEIAFFCIRPRLIKINDSKPAIEFLVVAKPDEWERRVRSSSTISDRQAAYNKFWAEFVSRYKKLYPDFKPSSWLPNRSSITMFHGGTDLRYLLRFSHGQFLISLWIGVNSKIHPHDLIERISTKKDYIEEQLGSEIEFDRKEGVISTKVNLYYDKEVDIINISDEERDSLIDWIIASMPKFKTTLQSIIQKFDSE